MADDEEKNDPVLHAWYQLKSQISGCADKKCISCKRNRAMEERVTLALKDYELKEAKAVAYDATERRHVAGLSCQCRDQVFHGEKCDVPDAKRSLESARALVREIAKKKEGRDVTG